MSFDCGTHHQFLTCNPLSLSSCSCHSFSDEASRILSEYTPVIKSSLSDSRDDLTCNALGLSSRSRLSFSAVASRTLSEDTSAIQSSL